MFQRSSLAAIAIVTAVAGWSAAQEYPPPPPIQGSYYFQHHASTAYEGWLRGQADLRRAWGEYNYNTALARRQLEEARSRYLDNERKRVETYFAVRDINRQARDHERRPRPSRDELVRNARIVAPGRLTAYEYQAAAGAIQWPAALRIDELEPGRQLIDRLFGDRTAENSGLGSENYQAIHEAIGQMQEQLKDRIDTVSPMEYIQAKDFLRRVDYEARHPLAVEALASAPVGGS
jgi:hypothetical protein